MVMLLFQYRKLEPYKKYTLQGRCTKTVPSVWPKVAVLFICLPGDHDDGVGILLATQVGGSNTFSVPDSNILGLLSDIRILSQYMQ